MARNKVELVNKTKKPIIFQDLRTARTWGLAAGAKKKYDAPHIVARFKKLGATETKKGAGNADIYTGDLDSNIID